MSLSEPRYNSAVTSTSKIVISALVLGFLANLLFYKRVPGISVPLFILVSLSGLFSLAWMNKTRLARKNIWLVAPLVLFASLVAVRANSFTMFLNLGAVVTLILLLAHLFQSGDIFKFNIFSYPSAILQAGFETGILQPPIASVVAWKETQQNGGLSPRTASILRGLFLALPVVIVFTILFSSADAVFEHTTREFLEFLNLDNLPELVMRIILTVVAAWLCLGGLAYALRKPVSPGDDAKMLSNSRTPLGFIEAAVILGCVNALFMAFVFIQFRYFFGGQQNISVAGFSYAEYTRRGFAELVFVAVFTLGLCLSLQAFTRRQSSSAHWGFEGLVSLLVLLTGVILMSAFQRLALYEDAYGWTQLRTYVHVFMICLGILLAVFLASVHFSNPKLFAFGLFLTCLGFILILNILNTDAFIARQNIARFASTGKLDVVYLATLSEDAVPELIWLLEAVGDEEGQVIGGALHDRLNRLEKTQAQGWPGWNWSRVRAYSLLQEARPVIEQYPAQRYYWNFPID